MIIITNELLFYRFKKKIHETILILIHHTN